MRVVIPQIKGPVRECYVKNYFRNETFFCDCANYYGWTGDNCDDPTAFVHWERFVSAISLFIQIYFLLIPTTRNIYLYITYKLKQKRAKNLAAKKY